MLGDRLRGRLASQTLRVQSSDSRPDHFISRDLLSFFLCRRKAIVVLLLNLETGQPVNDEGRQDKGHKPSHDAARTLGGRGR